MISRIKQNFNNLMESLVNKKDEILKQNKIINLESLLSFYEDNKKLFLNKKEVLLTNINKYVSTIDLKINLDLSFTEKIDINYINELIEKIKEIKEIYRDNYINTVESDIRIKVIEKFKKIIKFLNLLYINYIDIILNYSSVYFSKNTERAPPIKLNTYIEI